MLVTRPMRCTLLIAVSIVLWSILSSSPAVSAAESPPPVFPTILKAEDICFKVETHPALPLPYQAVRVRVSVMNVSNHPIGPVFSPHVGFELRSPHLAKPQDVSDFVLHHDVGYLGSEGGLEQERLEGQVPIILKPNQSISASYALAADWNEGRRKARLGTGVVPPKSWDFEARALFDAPGAFALRATYPLDLTSNAKADAVVHASVEIVTQIPRGADKEVIEQLHKDAALASALMSPDHETDSALLPKLEGLLQRFPDSSFAPYARFAIARCHMKGLGSAMRSSADLQRRFLRRLLNNLPSDRAQQTEWLADRCFPRDGQTQSRIKAVDAILDTLGKTESDLEKGTDRLMAFFTITDDDRAAAIKQLENIDSKNFPYRPNALLLLITALDKSDPAKVKTFETDLRQNHRDAVEFLRHYAIVASPEEWLSIRLNKAESE